MRMIDRKLLPEFFREVRTQHRTFELRKDDESIQAGDVLVLREWTPSAGYTGHVLCRVVTYVLRDCPEYGPMDGYCILAIQPIGWETERSAASWHCDASIGMEREAPGDAL